MKLLKELLEIQIPSNKYANTKNISSLTYHDLTRYFGIDENNLNAKIKSDFEEWKDEQIKNELDHGRSYIGVNSDYSDRYADEVEKNTYKLKFKDYVRSHYVSIANFIYEWQLDPINGWVDEGRTEIRI